MRKRDTLHALIRSLNTHEKRYFKVVSRLHEGEKNYLKLFDIMQNSEKYDVQAISRELNISPKQLGDEKRYLEDVLLKALRLYDHDKHNENITSTNYQNVRVLINRKQFQYALNMIGPALEVAEDVGKSASVEQLLRTKQFVIRHLGLLHEVNTIGGQLEQLTYHNWQRQVLLNLGDKFYAPALGSGTLDDVKNILSHPALKKPISYYTDIETRLLWIELHLNYYIYISPDAQKILKYSLMGLDLCEKEAPGVLRFIEYYMALHIAACTGYTLTCQYNELIAMANRFEKAALKVQNAFTRQFMHINVTSAKLFRQLAYLSMNDYSNAAAIGQDLCAEPDLLFGTSQKAEALLYYAISVFHLGQTKQAYSLSEEILLDYKETKPDTLVSARLLQIMIQMQDGNYQVVPYNINNTRVWAERNSFLQVIVNPALALFTALLKKRSQTDIKKLHAALQRNISQQSPLNDIDKLLGLESWSKTITKR